MAHDNHPLASLYYGNLSGAIFVRSSRESRGVSFRPIARIGSVDVTRNWPVSEKDHYWEGIPGLQLRWVLEGRNSSLWPKVLETLLLPLPTTVMALP